MRFRRPCCGPGLGTGRRRPHVVRVGVGRLGGRPVYGLQFLGVLLAVLDVIAVGGSGLGGFPRQTMSDSPTVKATLAGADGARRRVISVSSDHGLSPASLWARTLMRYTTSPVASAMRKSVCSSGRRSLSTELVSPAW